MKTNILNEVERLKKDLKPCMYCGGIVEQKRETFFVCKKCGQEYVACVEDMEK